MRRQNGPEPLANNGLVSAEATGNVILGFFLAGIDENLVGDIEFDQLTEPVLRVMVEGKDGAKVGVLAAMLAESVRAAVQAG